MRLLLLVVVLNVCVSIFGTEMFLEGLKYIGDVDILGLPCGNGTLFYASGRVKYTGGWKDGHYDGFGTKSFYGGVIYAGGWRNGNRHGHGITYYSSHEQKRTVGNWENGEVDDNNFKMYYTYPNGLEYEGGYHRGCFNGYGVLYSHYDPDIHGQNNLRRYAGYWMDCKPVSFINWAHATGFLKIRKMLQV